MAYATEIFGCSAKSWRRDSFFLSTVSRSRAVSSLFDFATLHFIKPLPKISFHFQDFSSDIIKEEVKLRLSIWIWLEIIFFKFNKAWLVIDLLKQWRHLILQTLIMSFRTTWLFRPFFRGRTLILASGRVLSLSGLFRPWLTLSGINLRSEIS